jgi:glycerol-3-phosphate O-acyltransferase
MINNSAKTCREVYEVLRVSPIEQLRLIPLNVLQNIRLKAEQSNAIVLKYDRMGNVILSNEAKAMIVALYRDYFLPDSEKAILDAKLLKNENMQEIHKKENYNNPNDPFYKK